MNCQICGAELPEGAMFCGECGSSTTATMATRKRQDPRPADTTIIQPLPRAQTVISVPVGGHGPASAPESSAASAAASSSEPVSAFDPFSEAGYASTLAPSEPESPSEQGRTSSQIAVALDADAGGQRGDRLIGRPTVRFVLQFSTGETVVVHGTGLIGRRPLPQPSEYFDHLIQIADVGMSVSKTHLEFGQHDGEFWVSDRFSGNGTAIRRPDEAAQRCEAGRRYLVPRGSRVEVADQFFMVI